MTRRSDLQTFRLKSLYVDTGIICRYTKLQRSATLESRLQSYEAAMMISRDSAVHMGGVTGQYDRAVNNLKIARLACAVGFGQNIHTSIFDAFSFPDNKRFG
jgi:capsule polysaccharide export protein KpsE/RkpR